MRPLEAALANVDQLSLDLGSPAVPGPRNWPYNRAFKKPSKAVPSGSQPSSELTSNAVPTPPFKGGNRLEAVPAGRITRVEIVIDHGSEVLGLRAALLGSMPRPTSLRCRSSFSPVPFIVTTSRAAWEAYRRGGGVAFGIIEWELLTLAYDADRFSPVSLSKWCEYKRLRPTWRLTRDEALGWLTSCSVTASASASSVTVGQVLGAWGASLVRVAYDAEVPR